VRISLIPVFFLHKVGKLEVVSLTLTSVPQVDRNHNEHLGDFDTFIKSNEKLVYKICNKYKGLMGSNRSVGEYEDFVNVATIGLIKAYRKFDPTRGVGVDGKGLRFSTYGVPMMIGEIQRHIRDNNAGVRFSRSDKEAFYKVLHADMIGEEHPEIMKKLNMTAAEVQKYENFFLNQHPIRLDETIHENDGDPITLNDQIGVLVDFDTKLQVQDFVSTLPDRLKRCYTLQCQDLTQFEIGKRMGISQVQVSRIIAKIYILAEQYGNMSGTSKGFSTKTG
jgi:RNA polymerase sporulation-specific sigma factor